MRLSPVWLVREWRCRVARQKQWHCCRRVMTLGHRYRYIRYSCMLRCRWSLGLICSGRNTIRRVVLRRVRFWYFLLHLRFRLILHLDGFGALSFCWKPHNRVSLRSARRNENQNRYWWTFESIGAVYPKSHIQLNLVWVPSLGWWVDDALCCFRGHCPK